VAWEFLKFTELFYWGKSCGIWPRLIDWVHGCLVHWLTTLIKSQSFNIWSTAEILKLEPFSYDLIVNAHHETDNPLCLRPTTRIWRPCDGGGSMSPVSARGLGLHHMGLSPVPSHGTAATWRARWSNLWRRRQATTSRWQWFISLSSLIRRAVPPTVLRPPPSICVDGNPSQTSSKPSICKRFSGNSSLISR
jgi:hypothetical protein